MSAYPAFAELINGYLEKRDRSLSWLARRLRVNHSTVSRWLNQETRPADPETVIRIADILGVHDAEARQQLLHAAGYGYLENPSNDLPPTVTTPPPEAATPRAPLSEPSTANANPAPIVHTPLPAQNLSARQTPFMTPALPPQGVLGRDELLLRLQELLRLGEDDVTDIPPVALHGMGGIGKTTLAIALGRHPDLLQFFPDGVLWTTLGPTPTIRNLLDDWGRAIGENLLGERDAEACQERLRSTLFRRRMLLIVDDVWEVAHGRLFMVAGPQSRTLFTTRESPVAYALTTRQQTLRVDVLSAEASLTLLARLAPEVVTMDKESAQRLCERLEFLPLALTLAGRMLAQEADVPARLKRLIGELLERREARLQLLAAEGRLGLDPDQPVSLHAILGMSVARLSKVEQERFAILSAFGGEPLTWELGAAAFLWECSEEEAELTISRFMQRGLVMQRGERYWLHALLADYAAGLLAALG